MEKKVAEILKGYSLTSKRFILAVSGGVDSITLLHIFSRIIPKENVVIAHINHGLRAQSNKEEQFVASLAKKYGLQFFNKKLELKNSSEETARTERYGFLTRVLKENSFDYIVTAHHLNDQIETFLLKLARGSGLINVWGMQQMENNIFRPLLDIPKEEILIYAKKNKLKWMEDKSNKDTRYARNRIRLEIIPQLTKINPDFLETTQKILKAGSNLAVYLEKKSEKALKDVTETNTINLKKFNKIDFEFLQKEVIKRMLHEMTGKKQDIYSKNIEEVYKLTQAKGSKFTKIRGYAIVKDYDKITFDPKTTRTQKRTILKQDTAYFNGFLIKKSKKVKNSMKNNILLPEDITYNLTIRTRMEGDRIKTAIGTKKLQDVFTDAKIPKSERDKWPVIVSGSEVIWVPLLAKAQLKGNKKVILEVVDERKKL